MPFSIIEGDISQVQADAVVNAANEQLLAGGGVCGAIFAGAGYEQMQAACDAIGHCATGDAVVTPGFGLPARFVIHAVGPVWRGGRYNEEMLLRSAYRRALECAVEVGARSVAFPLISAGIYGYPQDAARAVATNEIRAFLASYDDLTVMLCLYSREQFAWTLAHYQEVEGYVDAVTRRAQLAQDGAARSAAVFEAEYSAAAAEFSFPEGEAGFGASAGAPAENEEELRFFDAGAASGKAAPSQQGGSKRAAGQAAPSGAPFAAPAPSTAAAPSTASAPSERRAAAAGRKRGTGYAATAPAVGQAAPAAGQAAPAVSAQAAKRAASQTMPAAAPQRTSRDLTWRLAHLDASFSATVLALIDERGLSDAEVYKRANLSRQVFSKLRRDDGYRPAKQTAVALALALELDLEQTEDLLQRAGYALSRTNKFDVIVEYYIEKRNYDVFELNEMLFAFDQPLLGSL